MTIEMKISFEWTLLGPVSVDLQGKLAFPRAPTRPGIYRLEFDGTQGKEEYIGQTDTLLRRFQHYRTPGLSQCTNLRLNALMQDTINSKGAVSVSIVVDDAKIAVDGRVTATRMERASDRVLLEHAAIRVAKEAGIAMLNF